MSDQPIKHGHQHCPGGPDPIPCLEGTVYWAIRGDLGSFTAVADDTWTQIELDTDDTNDIAETYFDLTSVPFGIRLAGGYMYQVGMLVYWGGFFEGPTEIGWGVPPGIEYRCARTPATPPGTRVTRLTFPFIASGTTDLTLGAWQNGGSPAAEGHGQMSVYVVGPTSDAPSGGMEMV